MSINKVDIGRTQPITLLQQPQPLSLDIYSVQPCLTFIKIIDEELCMRPPAGLERVRSTMQEASCWPRKGRAMRPNALGQIHTTLTHESRDGQLCRRPPAGLEGPGPKKPGIHRANYTDHLHAKNSYAPGMCSGIHLGIWVLRTQKQKVMLNSTVHPFN